MKKKRAFTLLEIMIVITLIGLISGIIGYSMKGSLDKGRIFKTEQAALRIRDILELELAKGVDIDTMRRDPKQYVRDSQLFKDPDKMLVDGWGKEFVINVTDEGEVEVVSDTLRAAQQKVQ